MAAELNFEDLSRDIMIVDDLVLADTKVVAAFTITTAHFSLKILSGADR